MGPGQEKGGMMSEGMKHGPKMGMCPMHGMMMKMMGERSLAATSDGGVVILSGNKLSKYDKNLTLVKEVEVTMDASGMEKMMADMKEKCPQCKEMMERCHKMGPPPQEAPAAEKTGESEGSEAEQKDIK
jgi:hypothetical protein